MKALITSAGLGTRLEKIKHTNKCLLHVGDKSILERSISTLQRYGINDIYVITGHFADKVEKEVQDKATCIFNPFYKISGIVVSIWFSKMFLYNKEFIFLTGDVLYDPKLIEKILELKKEIVIPIEKKEEYDSEDSKVIVSGNKITKMGKDLGDSKISGEYCCITKFSDRGSKHFFDKIDHFLRNERLNTYLMDVFNELIEDGVHIEPLDITGIPRIEIDFLKDLEDAKEKILPCIDWKQKH